MTTTSRQTSGGTSNDSGITNVASLTQNELFDLLSSDTRRQLVNIFEDHSGPHKLQDLAVQIAKFEDDGGDTSEIHRMKVNLYHNHLPKMDSLDLINFDHESNRVEVISEDLLEQRLSELI